MCSRRKPGRWPAPFGEKKQIRPRACRAIPAVSGSSAFSALAPWGATDSTTDFTLAKSLIVSTPLESEVVGADVEHGAHVGAVEAQVLAEKAPAGGFEDGGLDLDGQVGGRTGMDHLTRGRSAVQGAALPGNEALDALVQADPG